MTCLDFERPLLELEARIRELQIHASNDPRFEEEIRRLEAQLRELSEQLYKDLSAWQKVQLSRHPDRPHMLDYVERLFDDVLELHGDRCYGDDPAIVAGFARLDGRTVAIVGHQKGRTTREKLRRNFGMAHPEGYRKAVRIMELAVRFRRPILTFIDTPGAYPGIGAEERGQSEAIGRAIFTMCALEVPIVSAIIGEGGSGGALALGVANRVLMMEFATYSVITPEGCASILWRDGSKAPLVAERLRLLAEDALRLGIIDEIVPEPMGGAHRDPDEAARRLGQALRKHLFELERIFQGQDGGRQLVEARRAKFRAMGAFLEE
ncbi:MAG: acetyl-CoA carboxylase carboxyltransferase subunit alpha [Sandaracinaceae bacterium]|nr:acetyl-CoA carboxylase carboxyltransferase subunit alpha [Sandaracinaceae bacterium]MDW8245527.1 acetyl-CoA carboxylase carboxyltransferase subunit alpha [Sandaracinaceae bacterium]